MKAEYIDHMGDDLRVVNAARVSFDKESEWECRLDHPACRSCDCREMGVEVCDASLADRDTKLLSYLARNGHWTPFSHPQVTLRETVPIFVARQRFKHMVGFTYNEVSRRYVDSEPGFYTPEVWRGRAPNAKQGSSEERIWSYPTIYEGARCFTKPEDEYDDLCVYAIKVYHEMLAGGVCPEQARMVLPQSMLTSYYVTGSLAAWARAYKLRIDLHAQAEIRELAQQWDTIIRPLFPVSWAALSDNT